jgi:glucokinase
VNSVLAVDVGGTTIKAAITEGDREVASVTSPTPRGEAARDAVAALGARLMEDTGPVVAAGVLLPGIVDPASRTGVYSANVGWSDLEFGGPLEEAWGINVGIGHDVTWAGRAEAVTGAAQGVPDFVFVALGTGIAAAIMSGGRMLTTTRANGQPGEIGHVPVRPDGPLCPCGARGCLEVVASAKAIATAYGAESAADVFAAADPRAKTVIKEAIEALADGLAALTTLIAPERIVLGGGLSLAGEALTEPLAKALTTRVRVQPVPDVVLGAHLDRAGLAGAALLALEVAP